ncbi:hypothetical protein LRU_02335, partial [Ligilactobacillus ruminis SPM0211]
HSSLALASDFIILSKLFVDVKNNFEKLFYDLLTTCAVTT